MNLPPETTDATGLCFTPATELAAMVRTKQVSPVEVMAAVLERAEALDPKFNAFATPMYESARAQAKAAEAAVMRGDATGPLHGVPWTVKDMVNVKGVKTMAGSQVFAERVAATDAPLVERMAAAGAIAIGKTTAPEFGWMGCGDSPLTGASHNPWKHGYNPGGSSAGAAICAAAGIGPLHQGGDGAGSIRMPAAFCGVYGIKPSFGRIPYWPTPNNLMIAHPGPLTRTVADAALMLEVMAGPDDRDRTSLEAPPEPYLARLGEGIRGKRIGWSPDLGYLKVDPEVAAIVRAALPAFEEQGAIVEEVGELWPDPIETEHCIFSTVYTAMIRDLLPEWESRMDPRMVAMARHGERYSAADVIQAEQSRVDLYERVRQLFLRYDYLVTPTLSVAAFPVNRIIPEHWEQHEWDWIRWAGFSYPFNLSWSPAATCPCGFTSEGLPVGIQIVAGKNRDLAVLQASRAFEEARPWAQHRPPC